MRGRPRTGTGPTVAGITPRQWAAALGTPTATGLRRALRIVRCATPVPAEEVALVADRCGVDAGELTRALAALRGYLGPDAPAGHPDGAPATDG